MLLLVHQNISATDPSSLVLGNMHFGGQEPFILQLSTSRLSGGSWGRRIGRAGCSFSGCVEAACLLAESSERGEGAALGLKRLPSSMFLPSALKKGWWLFFSIRCSTCVGLQLLCGWEEQ